MFEIYNGKTVLIFGNTGFVGTNLVLFLNRICNCNIIGYSNSDFFEYFNRISNYCSNQYYDDITDFNKVKYAIDFNHPDIVINLAAQAIVKTSYQNPKKTYETNILGTLNILEAIKQNGKVKAFVNITTDKVYKNKEQKEGYIETDELNGYDPYSNSKSCVELITESYRNCFFKDNETLIATLRSGNIIGMGDFGNHRLIPDIIRSWRKNEIIQIRYPNAVRPWIFILDTIMGYLKVGEKLLEGNKSFGDAWNFSSNYSDMITVENLVKQIQNIIDINYRIQPETEKETNYLALDSTKARKILNWKPLYNIDKTVEETMRWYKEYITNNKIITDQQIDEYVMQL
jgi:CDP-glucose 4,6-dehydratase